MTLTSVERDGDRYFARTADGLAWAQTLALDDHGSPFREALIWPAAGVVAIGCGKSVTFLSRDSGAIVLTVLLGDDLFGGFGPSPTDVLFVLGWTRVSAISRELAVLWRSEPVAVDGITWRDQRGDRVLISCELDPPGGWVDAELDAKTGERLR